MTNINQIRLYDLDFQLIYDSKTAKTPIYQHISAKTHGIIDYFGGFRQHVMYYRCPEGVKSYNVDSEYLEYMTIWPNNIFQPLEQADMAPESRLHKSLRAIKNAPPETLHDTCLDRVKAILAEKSGNIPEELQALAEAFVTALGDSQPNGRQEFWRMVPAEHRQPITELDVVIDAIWWGFMTTSSDFVHRGLDCIDVTNVDMEEIAKIVLKHLEKHQLIETVEQLKAIKPPSTELLGGPLIKAMGYNSLGDVYELDCEGNWDRLSNIKQTLTSENIPLPAWLIWRQG